MMRSMTLVALAAALLTGSGAAAATGGPFGATSSASVTIRVSVAPRAWQASSDTLCIAGPPTGYSLRSEGGSEPLRWSPVQGGDACTLRAAQVQLAAPANAGGTVLLVVPE